jgi:hypothetical protein
MIKSLWASVQGDPVFMRRVNGWLTIFWLVMIPVSLVTGWVSSVVYVSALSLWALVSGHWSAWQAARVEVKQQEEHDRDTAGQIARRVLREQKKETEVVKEHTTDIKKTVNKAVKKLPKKPVKKKK